MKLIALFLLVSSAAFAATEENINKTFPVSPGGVLVVDVDFGTIALNTNAVAAEIAVDVWRKITRKDKDAEEQFIRENPIQFLHEGGNLTVRCRAREKIRWFSGWRNRNEAKYTIRLPAQFSAKLRTSGGGIAVSDLTGEVKADTSGGGLHFTRVHGPLIGDTSGGGISVMDCGGAIRIHTSGGGIQVVGGNGSLEGGTSGGRVTVKNFGGPVSVKSSGGGMTIEKIGGKVNASTSGGSISAVLLSPVPGDVALSTSGGGVTVMAPEDAVFNIDAETSGGGVTCDLPATVQGKMKHNKLKGAVNGGGPAVVLRTSGGGIQIKRL
ncbi:MAG: DUF4097 family beta strand repeat-containing protein [Limisphaerales bacterium]